MTPWPARVSGECIFCTFRHISRPSDTSRSALRQSFKLESRRNVSLVRRAGQPQRPNDRATNKVIENKPNRSKAAETGDGSRGFKRLKFDHEKRKASVSYGASYSEIATTLLEQLRTLGLKIAGQRVSAKNEYSTLAALDLDGELWKVFEADTQYLIEKGIKGSKLDSYALSQAQLSLRKKLIKAQLPGKSNSLTPRAEVAKCLEFAYFDYILQSKKKNTSETDLFNPVEAYTDLRYPTEWYASARTTQRQIHLHVGPTNSGKTYNAIKRLEEAGNGYYCGPLRLLAHEIYARFQAKGIPCHLITGDDVRIDDKEDVKLRSSTVEMVDTNARVEVAVIDEIQMMAHEERGWAWTRAFLGSNAKEVHLCGETRVIPLVRELSASMGDTLHVHNYERLSPLKVMSNSLKGNLKLLRKGDCIVSFSVVGIHALKKEIERDTGRRVAIVYGSLPPETRAAQADLFNDPDNDYDFLVASDAIGMGLNLAVKRMIFESIYKNNGNRTKEILSIPQLKQIAGRAGRYRTSRQAADKESADTNGEAIPAPQAVGLVTCMEEADLPYIQEALRTEPKPIKSAGILPPAEFVEEFAARLPKGLPFEYVYQRICDVARMHPRFNLCEVISQTGIARVLDSIPQLTIKDRLIFSSSPANTKRVEDTNLLLAFGRCVADGKPISCVDIPEIPLEILDAPMTSQREYLKSLETLHRSLILYLWLSYRFLAIFKDREQATHAKLMTEQRINDTLTKFSHAAELKKRMALLKLRQVEEFQVLADLTASDGGKGLEALSPDLSSELLDAEPSLDETPLEPPSLVPNENEEEPAVARDSAFAEGPVQTASAAGGS